MTTITAASQELGISEIALRDLLVLLGVQLVDSKGQENVEVTPTLRLAVRVLQAEQSQNGRWLQLSEALNPDGSGAAPRSSAETRSRARGMSWIELLTLFVTAIGVGAAVWAVNVARTELSRAVDAFEVGNQYTFENEMIVAMEPFLSSEQDGPVLVMDARVGLGEKLYERNGVSEEFWSKFRHQVCMDVKKHICPGADSSAYVLRISDYGNIVSLCYAGVSEQTDLCELEVPQ